MKHPVHVWDVLERGTARVAVILGAGVLILSFFEPRWFPIAYRVAVFSCMAPALGSLVLILIHRITGGQWVSGLAPYLGAGVRALPWVWLLALPLLFLRLPAAEAGVPALGTWAYAGIPMVLARSLLAAGLFFMLRSWLSDGIGHLRQPRLNARPWIGPVGLILIFFMLTLVGDDWLESLEPGWHSTAFTVIWIASQVVSGLSLALLLALRAGARPTRDGVSGRPLGIDWGNLLLATMMFWMYVGFCQFLIIWAGNLPEEISWYLRREAGAWAWFAPLGALFGFAVPFFMLLMRGLKETARGLSAVACLLLTTQWAYTVWVIAPAEGALTLPAALLILLATGASAAAFLNRYARTARLLTRTA